MPNTVRQNTLASYINDIILGSFFQLPIWIVYQSSFLTYSQIAFYTSLAIIVEVIMQIPTGAFADIFGRRNSLSLGNLFMAIPMFLIAFYPDQSIMLIYAILWGTGRAFTMGTSKPILYETLVAHNKINIYQKILSNSIIYFQLSAAVSILLGGYLYQITPNLPYIASGTVSLIGIFTAYIFIEERSSKSFNLSRFANTIKGGFISVSNTTYMLRLTILYAFTLGIAHGVQQQLSQPYMLELGMGDIQRSWVAMIIKIGIAFLGAKIITIGRVVDHKYFLLIIPIIMVVSLLPASLLSLPLAYFTLILIAFNSGNTELFFSSEIQSHIDSATRSTAVSLMRMFASVVGAIIMYLSSFVVNGDSVGQYYSYLGIFALIFIVPLAYLQSHHKHKFVQILHP